MVPVASSAKYAEKCVKPSTTAGEDLGGGKRSEQKRGAASGVASMTPARTRKQKTLESMGFGNLDKDRQFALVSLQKRWFLNLLIPCLGGSVKSDADAIEITSK